MVLMAPEAIISTDRAFGLISVGVRTATVANSPMVSAASRISRQADRPGAEAVARALIGHHCPMPYGTAGGRPKI
jgi:hypothetical protein